MDSYVSAFVGSLDPDLLTLGTNYYSGALSFKDGAGGIAVVASGAATTFVFSDAVGNVDTIGFNTKGDVVYGSDASKLSPPPEGGAASVFPGDQYTTLCTGMINAQFAYRLYNKPGNNGTDETLLKLVFLSNPSVSHEYLVCNSDEVGYTNTVQPYEQDLGSKVSVGLDQEEPFYIVHTPRTYACWVETTWGELAHWGTRTDAAPTGRQVFSKGQPQGYSLYNGAMDNNYGRGLYSSNPNTDYIVGESYWETYRNSSVQTIRQAKVMSVSATEGGLHITVASGDRTYTFESEAKQYTLRGRRFTSWPEVGRAGKASEWLHVPGTKPEVEKDYLADWAAYDIINYDINFQLTVKDTMHSHTEDQIISSGMYCRPPQFNASILRWEFPPLVAAPNGTVPNGWAKRGDGALRFVYVYSDGTWDYEFISDNYFSIDRVYFDSGTMAAYSTTAVSYESHKVDQTSRGFSHIFPVYISGWDRFAREPIITSMPTDPIRIISPRVVPSITVNITDLTKTRSIIVAGTIIETISEVLQNDTEATLYDGKVTTIPEPGYKELLSDGVYSSSLLASASDGSFAVIIPTLADPSLSWGIAVSATGVIGIRGPGAYTRVYSGGKK